MENLKEGEPTSPRPIFVGPGPSGDQATEFLLNALDWLLQEEEVSLLYPIEGEISDWIEQLWKKPVQVDQRDIRSNNETAVQRELLRESFATFADPRNVEEKGLAELLGNLSLDDVHPLGAALKLGDPTGINAVRSELVEKLGKLLLRGLMPAQVFAFASMVGRCRAGRASALCLILHKIHPLALIGRARKGDRRAVLDLIMVDKLFLTDNCTREAIRLAEFRNDRVFLKQLARSITSKCKVGWKKGCRLYLYTLFALAPDLPALSILNLRLDPEGARFRTFPAFEKFVERCRKDFSEIQSAFVAQASEKSK